MTECNFQEYQPVQVVIHDNRQLTKLSEIKPGNLFTFVEEESGVFVKLEKEQYAVINPVDDGYPSGTIINVVTDWFVIPVKKLEVSL